ncbi:CBS and ACT domain-containing protein [Spirochaeta cellobiosiphila]|uniref:CBS and ACT domain-containing protein n=1 Tax=Spirochaeta cellobiosiphila TaxID=504483 RepID=UPI000410F5AF|nr:CBS domain-containing protein [Spirochaeta cellobiosiphila]
MNVARRMSKNPITITAEMAVTDAQALMNREKVHRLPVLDKNKKIIGIVTEKDLLYASPSPASTLNVYEMTNLLSKLKVKEIMTKKVITANADDPIEDAARTMADNNIGGLPVVKGELLVGIITESDIFKTFIELFGAREQGIRLTLEAPDRQGQLADIADTIRSIGANVVSIGSFLGEEASHGLIIIKLSGVDVDTVQKAFKSHQEILIDLREV